VRLNHEVSQEDKNRMECAYRSSPKAFIREKILILLTTQKSDTIYLTTDQLILLLYLEPPRFPKTAHSEFFFRNPVFLTSGSQSFRWFIHLSIVLGSRSVWEEGRGKRGEGGNERVHKLTSSKNDAYLNCSHQLISDSSGEKGREG